MRPKGQSKTNNEALPRRAFSRIALSCLRKVPRPSGQPHPDDTASAASDCPVRGVLRPDRTPSRRSLEARDLASGSVPQFASRLCSLEPNVREHVGEPSLAPGQRLLAGAGVDHVVARLA
jgi:hypothetical protein